MALSYMDRWFEGRRRKALIIRGARQVGKSTLVRQFAAKRGLQLFEINLEQYPSESIWASMRSEIILREMELTIQKKLDPEMLLFIDEIQACPKAIQALRYLVEERPELAVVAAGSLLEFVLGREDFSMPVGRVSYYHLGPMSFREVLRARKKDVLEESLQEMQPDSWSRAAHAHLRELYMDYLFTGGMPEAVQASIGENSILAAREVQRSIAATYQDDFGKYEAKVSAGLMRRVFQHVPMHLGEKVKYVNISREYPAKVLNAAVKALIDGRIVLPVYHSNCSGLPLKAGRNERAFKLFFLDVGLALYLSGTQWEDLTKSDLLLINRGNISEQFVAQHLAYRHGGLEYPEVDYWLREGRTNNAEVDFVIAEKGRILPIEVKAGKTGSLRSVHQFVARTGVDYAIRFDMDIPTLQRVATVVRTADGSREISFNLASYPVYSVESLIEARQLGIRNWRDHDHDYMDEKGINHRGGEKGQTVEGE